MSVFLLKNPFIVSSSDFRQSARQAEAGTHAACSGDGQVRLMGLLSVAG